MEIEKRLFSAQEAAEYLGLSVKTIYNLTSPKSKRKLPIKVKRIGKLLKFDRAELDRFIDSL